MFWVSLNWSLDFKMFSSILMFLIVVIIPLFFIYKAWKLSSIFNKAIFLVYLSSSFLFVLPLTMFTNLPEGIKNIIFYHRALSFIYSFSILLTFFSLSYKNENKIFNYGLFYFMALTILLIAGSLVSGLAIIS